MSAVVLDSKTERIVEKLFHDHILSAPCIVISTDANTGNLVGRFVDKTTLQGLPVHEVGRVLKHITVFCFGVEPHLLKKPHWILRLQPVRSPRPVTETNLSFFFDVMDQDLGHPQHVLAG